MNSLEWEAVRYLFRECQQQMLVDFKIEREPTNHHFTLRRGELEYPCDIWYWKDRIDVRIYRNYSNWKCKMSFTRKEVFESVVNRGLNE